MLCGLKAEFCVYNTAKAALDRGYNVAHRRRRSRALAFRRQTASDISEEVNTALEVSGAALQSTAASSAAACNANIASARAIASAAAAPGAIELAQLSLRCWIFRRGTRHMPLNLSALDQ